jgi:tetratricopeptide (TPR) repeat protein
MSHVYPVVMGSRRVPEPPTGSIYPNIFQKIESGLIPEVGQQNSSFLTVLTIPVVVLYTDEKTVEAVALDYINQAMQMNKKSVLPLYLRGYIYQRNARFNDALTDYSAALELDPSCYPAEIGIAQIYIQTGRNDAAVEIIDMLAAQYPYSIKILTTAAETRFLIKDYSRALEYSSEVLRIAPDNPQILLLRAKIFLAQNNLQQAGRLIEVINR